MSFQHPSIYQQTKALGFEIFVVILILFTPLMWLVSYPLKLFAVLISSFKTSHGKFVDTFGVTIFEDYANCNPRTSIVTTVTLYGDLSLGEIKRLFTSHVLEAVIPTNEDNRKGEAVKIQVRYPEFKQYISLFMGFPVWKNDPKFHLDNHMIEQSYFDYIPPSETSYLSLIHQDLMNRRYEKRRSPWELVVIPKVKIMEEDDYDRKQQTILAFRIHHSMGDAKSIIKLFVECLGKRQPKIPKPHKPPNESAFTQIKSVLMFPVGYFLSNLDVFWSSLEHPFHPFKTSRSCDRKTCTRIIRFSERLDFKDVKNVASHYSIAPSSVLLSIISSVIHKHTDIGDIEIPSLYIMPKPNHPKIFTNHMHIGFIKLMADEKSIPNLLYQADKLFMDLKASYQHLYNELNVFLLGNLHKLFLKLPGLRDFHSFAMLITNIAGEQKGFSVGGLSCSDFALSSGLPPGYSGVGFCIFSYKNEFRVEVIAEECVMDCKLVERIAAGIGKELESLNGLTYLK